ncbi:MAG: hypothetical protein FWD06_00895 [Oscillospiraceae bacterium]|nr:hypothetical protein [Oscillospiraceae bacterium]
MALPTQLYAMLTHESLPHALLLEGGTQAFRREVALELAQALLCESQPHDPDQASLFGEPEPTPKPCSSCNHCHKALQNIHPDLHLAEGGTGTRSFHIDAIRDIRRQASVLPNEAEHKVFVLHNAHSMTAEAQNALLKLLEEPPDYVCLILTAPARKLLLQTVISRVATVNLGPAAEEALDPEREALLQQHATVITQAMLHGGRPYAMLQATAPLEGDRELLRELLPCLRRALHARLIEDITLTPRALRLIDELRTLEDALHRNANLNLLITRLATMNEK